MILKYKLFFFLLLLLLLLLPFSFLFHFKTIKKFCFSMLYHSLLRFFFFCFSCPQDKLENFCLRLVFTYPQSHVHTNKTLLNKTYIYIRMYMYMYVFLHTYIVILLIVPLSLIIEAYNFFLHFFILLIFFFCASFFLRLFFV